MNNREKRQAKVIKTCECAEMSDEVENHLACNSSYPPGYSDCQSFECCCSDCKQKHNCSEACEFVTDRKL
jgi:hypothetical protein